VLRDMVDRKVGFLEQLAGEPHPLLVQPLQRGGPHFRCKATHEGSPADRGLTSEIVEAERLA
jgi:hypothetical protein